MNFCATFVCSWNETSVPEREGRVARHSHLVGQSGSQGQIWPLMRLPQKLHYFFVTRPWEFQECGHQSSWLWPHLSGPIASSRSLMPRTGQLNVWEKTKHFKEATEPRLHIQKSRVNSWPWNSPGSFVTWTGHSSESQPAHLPSREDTNPSETVRYTRAVQRPCQSCAN